MGKHKKTRLYVMIEKPYVDQLDRLVEEGIYLGRGDAIRDALRSLFRSEGIEQFSARGAELTEDTEK